MPGPQRAKDESLAKEDPASSTDPIALLRLSQPVKKPLASWAPFQQPEHGQAGQGRVKRAASGHAAMGVQPRTFPMTPATPHPCPGNSGRGFSCDSCISWFTKPRGSNPLPMAPGGELAARRGCKETMRDTSTPGRNGTTKYTKYTKRGSSRACGPCPRALGLHGPPMVHGCPHTGTNRPRPKWAP